MKLAKAKEVILNLEGAQFSFEQPSDRDVLEEARALSVEESPTDAAIRRMDLVYERLQKWDGVVDEDDKPIAKKDVLWVALPIQTKTQMASFYMGHVLGKLTQTTLTNPSSDS